MSTGMNEPTSAYLSIENITKYYKIDGSGGINEVISNFSLNVSQNDFLCILGSSGCGKSTLLRCVGGFEQFDGSIFLDGSPVKEPGTDRIMVFQDFNQLFPWKTVLENVKYPLRREGIRDKTRQNQLAEDVLKKVGLEDYCNYYPHQLSGGMKQRAAIARAIVLNPKVILMDEPFASLDAITRNNLQQELLSITASEGVTILFVTHNIQEALVLGTRILVLSKNGDIVINEPNPLPKPVKPSTSGYAEAWNRYNLALHTTPREQMDNG